MVGRHAYDEDPPRVEYALTPLGRSLRAVRLRAGGHVAGIEAVRARQSSR
ncbi:winged helix-turn-helix transcriptional regulator [Streptomyces nogalater]